jgi:CBS domain-containing protein
VSGAFDAPVRDYASKTPITVRPETPLPDVQALFDAHDISAVAVVDAAGALAGIFTTTDMLQRPVDARLNPAAPIAW